MGDDRSQSFFWTQSGARFPPSPRRALTLAKGCGQTGMVLETWERPLFMGSLAAGWQLPLVQGRGLVEEVGIPKGAGEGKRGVSWVRWRGKRGWHLHGISPGKAVAEARAPPELREVLQLPEGRKGMSLPGSSLRLAPSG